MEEKNRIFFKSITLRLCQMVNEQSGGHGFLKFLLLKAWSLMIHVGRVVFYFVSQSSKLHMCL